MIEKGYEVHGIIRRASTMNTSRIQHLYADPKCHKQGKMKLYYGDMTDSTSLIKIISQVQPTEIYNLAAQSHVKVNYLIEVKSYLKPLKFEVLTFDIFRLVLI